MKKQGVNEDEIPAELVQQPQKEEGRRWTLGQ